MALARVNDEDLIWKVADVFRRHGFEGTSLSRLAAATGLEKASLYHRFPGGKEDMAAAVVQRVNEWFGENVIGPIEGTGTPQERVRRVAARLREFYDSGKKPCALDALSIAAGSDRIRDALRDSAAAWLQAFTGIARESGYPAAEARVRAEQAIVEVQGSLVLARVTGESKLFLRTLGRLPELLTGTKD